MRIIGMNDYLGRIWAEIGVGFFWGGGVFASIICARPFTSLP